MQKLTVISGNDVAADKCSFSVGHSGPLETILAIPLFSRITFYKVEGSQSKWFISSMLYSTDTPFWSETLDEVWAVNCRFM